MLTKAEIIEEFDNLEKDIEILKQMVEMKDYIIGLVESGDEAEKDKAQAEFDALDEQLKIVQLF